MSSADLDEFGNPAGYADPEEDEDEDEEGWAMPPYVGGKLRIMTEMCSTCIFRPGNKMDLERGRVANIMREVRRNDSYVTCHKTLGTGQPGVICKGSSEAHFGQMERIGRRLGAMLEMTEEEVLAESERYLKERQDADQDQST